MSLLIAGSIATDHLMTFGGQVRRLPGRRAARQALGLLPGRRPRDPPRRLRRPTSASASAASGCGRCWSARPARTSSTTAPGWSGTAWTATPCASPRPSTPPGSCARPTRRWPSSRRFYPGAMSEARLIELAPIVGRVGDADYVLVGAGRPARGCCGTPRSAASAATAFIADPSQQLAFGDGELIRELIDGAAYPVLQRVRVAPDRVRRPAGRPTRSSTRVGTQVITLGTDGVRIVRPGRGDDRGARRARTSRRSSRPASATPSAPASWRRWSGALASSGPPRSAACWRRTSSRGRHPGVHLHRRAVRGAAGRRRTATRPRPTAVRTAPDVVGSAGSGLSAPHHVARHAVVGGVLADVLLPAHAAPRRDVDARGGVVGRDRDASADLDRRRCRRRAR